MRKGGKALTFLTAGTVAVVVHNSLSALNPELMNGKSRAERNEHRRIPSNLDLTTLEMGYMSTEILIKHDLGL